MRCIYNIFWRNFQIKRNKEISRRIKAIAIVSRAVTVAVSISIRENPLKAPPPDKGNKHEMGYYKMYFQFRSFRTDWIWHV